MSSSELTEINGNINSYYLTGASTKKQKPEIKRAEVYVDFESKEFDLWLTLALKSEEDLDHLCIEFESFEDLKKVGSLFIKQIFKHVTADERSALIQEILKTKKEKE